MEALFHDYGIRDILRKFGDPRLITDKHEAIHPKLALGRDRAPGLLSEEFVWRDTRAGLVGTDALLRCLAELETVEYTSEAGTVQCPCCVRGRLGIISGRICRLSAISCGIGTRFRLISGAIRGGLRVCPIVTRRILSFWRVLRKLGCGLSGKFGETRNLKRAR